MTVATRKSTDVDLPSEVLMCAGGPLHGKRLSVPAGLQWFTLMTGWDGTTGLSNESGTPISIEHVAKAVGAANHQPASDLHGADDAWLYTRRSFITGEKGLIEVFQAAAGGCD